jgi:hypothetical protein
MLEAEYQAQLIKRRIRPRWVEAIVIKNDAGHRQGIPDLTIFFPDGFWAWLEVKISEKAGVRPNQNYYVAWANDCMFGAFIYPENEDEVLDDLQQAHESYRATCLLVGK